MLRSSCSNEVRANLVDGESMKRICTVCSLQGAVEVRDATHVATASNKMQWFECGQHSDTEHAEAIQEADDPMATRCALVPLGVWLEQNGLEE